MKNILILCTGNSCRSQIAHGYFDKFSNNKCVIYSAGIETHGLNPNAVQTMLRDTIDISRHTSNNVNEYININFDIPRIGSLNNFALYASFLGINIIFFSVLYKAGFLRTEFVISIFLDNIPYLILTK